MLSHETVSTIDNSDLFLQIMLCWSSELFCSLCTFLHWYSIQLFKNVAKQRLYSFKLVFKVFYNENMLLGFLYNLDISQN